MYGNMRKTDRPLLFLQNHPGWHSIADIALACNLTRTEAALSLHQHKDKVAYDSVYAKFSVNNAGGFCMKLYEPCYKWVGV